jgi:hypothetical protein
MVSPLARSLAPTHGTCSSHNMHAVHKSPWPCQVTAQAAQTVAHSMTSVSGGRISARLHPSSVHRDTQSHRAEALPSTRSRIAPTTSPERHSRSKMVTIFSVTSMGSRAAATGDQPDQLQDLGHDDRRQAPARPASHCPSPMPVRRTMILPLSRSPRRRAVG